MAIIKPTLNKVIVLRSVTADNPGSLWISTVAYDIPFPFLFLFHQKINYFFIINLIFQINTKICAFLTFPSYLIWIFPPAIPSNSVREEVLLVCHESHWIQQMPVSIFYFRHTLILWNSYVVSSRTLSLSTINWTLLSICQKYSHWVDVPPLQTFDPWQLFSHIACTWKVVSVHTSEIC